LTAAVAAALEVSVAEAWLREAGELVSDAQPFGKTRELASTKYGVTAIPRGVRR
jgi:hypothetical protein